MSWRGRTLLVVALAAASGLVLFVGPQLATAGTSSTPIVVGTNSTAVNGNTVVVTLTAAVPLNSTVFVAAGLNRSQNGSFASVADSRSNTYTADANINNTNGKSVALIRAPVTTALAVNDTVTVTFGGGMQSTLRSATVYYVKGLRLTTPLDGTVGTATNNSAVAQATTVGATTNSNDFIAGAVTSGTVGAGNNSCTALTAAGTGGTMQEEPVYKTTTSNATQTCGAAVTSGEWAAVTASYKVDVTNPNAPTITFPSASFYRPATWTTIAGTASDDAGGSGIVSDAVQIKDNTNATYWNGSTWQAGATSNTATGTTSWTYALAAANLTDGHNYTVSVTSTDNATNVSSPTTKSFTYDATNPNAPAITFPSANFYGPSTWTTIAGTASDNVGGSGIVSDAVQIKDNTNSTYWNGSTWQAGATSNTATGTTSWTYAIASANLTDAHNYTISVTSTDNAGNLSSATTKSFTYDSTPPAYASSATNTLGTQITVNYTEATSGLNTGVTPATSAFTVTGCSASCSVTNVSVASSTTVVLTLASRIYGGASPTVAYTQPGTNNLQDNAGNLAATIGAQSVTNTATASLSQSTISAGTNPIVNDGVTSSTITVQLKNSAGSNLTSSGGTVTVSTTVGTFAGACTTNCATTDNGNGTYTATLTSTTVGTATISAKLDGSALTNTTTVTINPSPCTSCTWTGAGGDANWSTPANWQGTHFPATGGTATLTFPNGASQLTNNNDETAGTTFAGIVISGSGYTLGGNQVTLGSGGISDTTGSGGSTISLALTSTAVRTVSVTNAAETLTLSGAYSGTGGGITKSGAGVLILTGLNSYTGNTTISGGTLNANASAALGGPNNTLVFSGGTLQAGGTITSPSTRSVTLSSTGLIDTNGNSVSIAGVISGSGTGLTKTGTGILTLSANNTYSGTTTVSAGTLTVNGSQSASAVSLNGGTLNGTGTTGAITSTASGGTVAPGSPPPGILSSGNVNLSSGSPTFSVALNGTTAGTSYSQLNVTGTVNLTGATLSGSLGYTPTNGDSYTIINNDSTDAVTGTFAGLPEGTGLVIGGYSFRISYVGGTGNDVVLTAGGATKLAITSVPPTATANVNFSVTVQSQDANGNCVQVNSNTGISLASDGAGTLSGNTATIAAGTCSVTLNSVQDDQGETIHLTASRTSGDSLTTSAASSAIVVANGTFTTNTAVAINGTPTVGTATTLTPGSYTPFHTGTSYQWQLCDSGGGSCANISGATNNTYTPVAGDVGGTLKVIETITRAGYNNGGSTSATSPLVIKGDFTFTSDVVIDGVPTVGTTLTITNSVYSPTVTTRTQQWQQCDSGGGSCVDIGGETNKTYAPVYGDVGMTLRVVQTVSRAGYNDAVSTSAASPVVVNGDFTTSTAVSINGTPTVGTVTTLTAGSYSPTPLSTAYQWRLCDSAGNNCADIGGANSSTYTPVPGQEGSTLRVVETVSQNGYNDGDSTSDRATVVVGPITTNTAVAISGTPTVGISSGITQGTYTPSPTSRSYQWKRCDNTGANCTKISGATSNTYTPVAGDAGATLRVVETATKFGYSDATSTSAASSVVANGSFSTTTAVSVNGTPKVGTPTTLTAGTYTPTPTGLSYQWRLCNSGGTGCADIVSATNPTYTPVAGDVGMTLRVVETVSASGYNNSSSTSAASLLVIKGNISTTTAVAINGALTVGTATTITTGVYSPAPTSSTYQWRLCDSSGASCSDISGANANTYTPLSGQIGMTLRVVETPTKAGYNNGTSTSSAVVVKGIFSTTVPVAINGTPKVGVKGTTTGGTYSPTPTGRSYQWKRCDTSGNNCVLISGATYNTYTPVAADVGKTLRVVETVKKTNYVNGSSTSAASPLVIKGTFVMATQVAVFGYPKHGVTSGITQGSYTPNPTARTYQWMRCTSTILSSCVNISGATAKTYKPVTADIGKRLRVIETVSAPGYNNLSVTSLASTAVT